MPGFFYPLSKLCANDFIVIDNYSKPLKLLYHENTSFKLIMHLSAQTEHTMYILVFCSKKIFLTLTLVFRSNSYVMLFPWQPPISILFAKIVTASQLPMKLWLILQDQNNENHKKMNNFPHLDQFLKCLCSFGAISNKQVIKCMSRSRDTDIEICCLLLRELPFKILIVQGLN